MNQMISEYLGQAFDAFVRFFPLLAGGIVAYAIGEIALRTARISRVRRLSADAEMQLELALNEARLKVEDVSTRVKATLKDSQKTFDEVTELVIELKTENQQLRARIDELTAQLKSEGRE